MRFELMYYIFSVGSKMISKCQSLEIHIGFPFKRLAIWTHYVNKKASLFKCWPYQCRTSFWPSSMVYISVWIGHYFLHSHEGSLHMLRGELTHVVYFNQQLGAPHAVRRSKSFFWFIYLFIYSARERQIDVQVLWKNAVRV